MNTENTNTPENPSQEPSAVRPPESAVPAVNSLPTVRAKFRCDRVHRDAEGNASVALLAVYDSNPESENGRFFRYTPSGRIDLAIVNPSAAAAFVEGKEYFVDFTPAN